MDDIRSKFNFKHLNQKQPAHNKIKIRKLIFRLINYGRKS
jgi:hypothetical protein